MIDIGVNFENKQLKAQKAKVISDARATGVTAIFATGTNLEVSVAAVELSKQYPGYIYATAGVHPHYAGEWQKTTGEQLALLCEEDCVIAIGECGLDYNRMFSARDTQLKVFQRQLHLAHQLGKPVFLHCRDAFEDFIALASEFPTLKGVVHCFTGSAQEAELILNQGFDIGITGWVCDEKRGVALREALCVIPMDRLHLETDAPFLKPKSLTSPGRTNVPENIGKVAEAVADLLQIPTSMLIKSCTQNTVRLFNLKNHP